MKLDFADRLSVLRLFGKRNTESGSDAALAASSVGDVLSVTTVGVIELVDELIARAHGVGASDIHIEPEGKQVRVRLRVDGVLRNDPALPKDRHAEVVSRTKILAGLRTDEHQAAQDGRFRVIQKDGQAIDVRVSIAPTYHGENIVLRLLAEQHSAHTLQSLGFSPANEQKILQAICKPFGMILATGPTGSGKTTTLYSLVKLLSVPEVSVVTIEDPVEYAVDGITQIPVQARTGLTFANGLRSMLRQDPNVIMVGEIRDNETAGLAVNTALTGHLVLTTLHTNDAATTLPRLLDMGVEPYLIASTVNVAIGQRLVRKICSDCKQAKELTEAEMGSLIDALPDSALEGGTTFFEGKGCEMCGGSGYMGRVGIHEVLVVDSEIREAILRKVSATEICALAKKQGMSSLVEDGFEKARAGVTTISEVLRMIYD